MAELLKKTGDKLKKAGHTVEEKASAAGHKTAKGAEHAVGRMDFLCDNCGKRMKMGGEYTRIIMGKEHQFCSVQCSNHYHPPMK